GFRRQLKRSPRCHAELPSHPDVLCRRCRHASSPRDMVDRLCGSACAAVLFQCWFARRPDAPEEARTARPKPASRCEQLATHALATMGELRRILALLPG